MYSDKKHPIRSVIIALVGLIIVTPLQLIFLFRDFSPSTTYYIILATTMLTLPITTLYTMAAFPLTMRLFPPERYGQFCAAQAMLGALGIMAGGVLAGAFMDIMKRMTGGGTYFYRYSPVWSWFFLIASFLCMLVVFKYWKAYGGDKDYHAPAVGCVVE
jgi:MFS family permease